ncbi:hypothetical protein CNYM01_12593 [Colletotrichum nymphaeae SA-01]|uniref:Uncharacterized protein n=1 Tax=Colletotrichum nymphaeae SA-01 TaxID=1460502 RepID=A0A135UW15_9PEZI|nr:hypothetical protein CNYM01_12593 [Colletotrichum nymphaeae SA-01]
MAAGAKTQGKPNPKIPKRKDPKKEAATASIITIPSYHRRPSSHESRPHADALQLKLKPTLGHLEPALRASAMCGTEYTSTPFSTLESLLTALCLTRPVLAACQRLTVNLPTYHRRRSGPQGGLATLNLVRAPQSLRAPSANRLSPSVPTPNFLLSAAGLS